MMEQLQLIDTKREQVINKSKTYKPVLSITLNNKGVIDIDTVKGCVYGMSKYPNGGCYGECYAYKDATRYGIEYKTSVSRKFQDREHRATVLNILNEYKTNWYRVGVAGDPSYDWDNTITVCRALRYSNKTPVIITKHWIELTDSQIDILRKLNVVINTSTSGLDSDSELLHRVKQAHKLEECGVKSVTRVVTCKYGTTEFGNNCNDKQSYLLSQNHVINNPLRLSKDNKHYLNGDILAENIDCAIGGGKFVSLMDSKVYLGVCKYCPDQCGVDKDKINNCMEDLMVPNQIPLFDEKVEFEYVKSVIGSGYEQAVAKLAVEDGIAHRAARKNMQIHSAIILKINGEFSGFFTFQNNEEYKEFCLLQSVIYPDKYSDDLYKQMVNKVIEQNVNKYPALITTNPKSKFETPKVFESCGFKTYLEMSGFAYMVNGDLSAVRKKLLAHITMTNTWNSTKKDWLRIKQEWNNRINSCGEKYGIQNATFATREGCWQGEHGFANVVTGHSHNGNASVLDPVVCEIILQLFMPLNGKRVYNPFGGGVQFGFISGAKGYEYLASEIRKNQCDANNKLCSEFNNVKWVQSDSSTYSPDGMYDLVFACPPYYKVETYIDYGGVIPEGEINSLSSYEEFEHVLFKGYKKAIEKLNDNCFFVIMTGDSRNKNGGYYCSEAKTELFLKEQGLEVYNKIIYLEPEFTRLAQAKKTLNYRKFPKCEQKIIVAYKGKIDNIIKMYEPIGRL